MKVQLILNVPKLKTTKEAQDFVLNLAEHVLDTFNDDNSIKEFWTRVPNRKDTK
jgi:hypothetical protein